MPTPEAPVIEALLRALATVHLPASVLSPGDSGEDLLIEWDGRRTLLQVKHWALVDRAQASHLLQDREAWTPRSGRAGVDVVPVVVGDRIVADARDRLRAAGISWLDLRGHLHLRAPGLFVDVPTERVTGPREAPPALGGRVGLATAIDILLTRPRQVLVRETARRIDAAPSSVSAAMKSLREEGIADDRGRVDVTALFWATARRWRPRWTPVSRYPHPDGPLRNPALLLGFDDRLEPGWALTGDIAAAHLGAPIGLAAGAPPDLYVPTSQAHRLAVSILGAAPPTEAPAARLAVPPVPAACEIRTDVSERWNEHWLLTRELFVALDLAQDPGRGAEILEEWEPAYGGSRVW